MHEVWRAAERQDVDVIKRRAHVLQATAATLGADRLTAMAAALEAAQSAHGPPAALDAVGEMKAEFARVVHTLRHIAETRLASA